MTDELPRWARWLRAAERADAGLRRAVTVVRDETLHALTSPDERTRVAAALYGRQARFLPGGERFEAGLFEWERRAFFEPPFPTSGRILVGAAGGGRELRAFVERGFEVVAFEPSETLARACEGAFPSAKVLRASYDDLVARRPPLSHFLDGGFDAVVLGWGSLAHLTGGEERRALFCALQQIAPRAPVVASLLVGEPARDKIAALRRATRRILNSLGARWTAEGEIHFDAEAGFTAVLSPAEVEALAAATGYTADRREEHVIFVPSSEGAAR